jgi:Ala-tRNA(Pro) deacylase
MQEFLDITPGSVSVLGLMNDSNHRVQLLVDSDVLNQEAVGCHPCMNTSSLKIRINDLMNKFLPFTGHEPVIVDLN